MEKVIREGKVAILISPDFGAGWFTWNSDHKELLFHPKIVEMVKAKRQSEIDEQWMLENLGLADIYCGGAENLTIVWLEEGTPFSVEEYDGSESIMVKEHLTLTA